MRAALVLEDGECPLALDREDDFLEAPLLALAGRQGLGPEATTLRIAGQHAVDVACPDRGFVAPDPLAHLDDDVLLVRRVLFDERELELVLEPRELLLELGCHARELRIAARVFEIGLCVTPRLGELLRALELLQASARIRDLAPVAVDGRVGHTLLRFGVGALQLVDETLDRAHTV
jgi:hypothetical protein